MQVGPAFLKGLSGQTGDRAVCFPEQLFQSLRAQCVRPGKEYRSCERPASHGVFDKTAGLVRPLAFGGDLFRDFLFSSFLQQFISLLYIL